SPSRSSNASAEPVEAPEGTDADAHAPPLSSQVTATVGRPRLSRTSIARNAPIVIGLLNITESPSNELPASCLPIDLSFREEQIRCHQPFNQASDGISSRGRIRYGRLALIEDPLDPPPVGKPDLFSGGVDRQPLQEIAGELPLVVEEDPLELVDSRER